jgi:hypothetical protein
MLKPKLLGMVGRIAFPTIELARTIEKARIIWKVIRPDAMSPKTVDIFDIHFAM